jgi:GTP-binding protein EngB required for normal cell division
MLTENHHRYLLVTFQHLDGLLSDAADRLGSIDTHRLFVPYRPDATPVQQKVLRDYLDQARFAMKGFMDRHGLKTPEPSVSALWSFHTALTFARVAVHELRPEYLQGYGALQPDDLNDILQLVAELSAVLHRVGAYLKGGEGGDLSGRLEHLEGTADQVGLLRLLADVIDHHGLVEYRSSLDDLISRLESPRYEVAFFGRVSSGKSSLLNFLVGRSVLPVGVTPVTSVVARLRYGIEPRVLVEFAEEPRQITQLERLADYVTETRNPSNAKHVTSVTVELSADVLKSGVHLIDTPGLGTLATAGAAQTLAYLPRCDLGVTLVDGAATLDRNDLNVARHVIENGSELLVLLSRADLIQSNDRAALLTYIHEQFESQLRVNINATPISTATEATGLASAWVETELKPRLARLQELADLSLRRKIGVLREAVMATLETNVASTSAPEDLKAARQVKDRLLEARAEIVATRQALDEATFGLSRRADQLIALAVDDQGIEGIANAADEIAQRISGSLAYVADAMHKKLLELHASVRGAIEFVSGSRRDRSDLPRHVDRPLFDHAFMTASADFALPWWAAVSPLRKAAWRQSLTRRWGKSLEDHLSAYANALRQWSDRYCDDLSRAFDMQVASSESRLRVSASRIDSEPSVREDLERLSAWPQQTERYPQDHS